MIIIFYFSVNMYWHVMLSPFNFRLVPKFLKRDFIGYSQQLLETINELQSEIKSALAITERQEEQEERQAIRTLRLSGVA